MKTKYIKKSKFLHTDTRRVKRIKFEVINRKVISKRKLAIFHKNGGNWHAILIKMIRSLLGCLNFCEQGLDFKGLKAEVSMLHLRTINSLNLFPE